MQVESTGNVLRALGFQVNETVTGEIYAGTHETSE